MKLIHKYLILGVAAAGAFTACDNYDADDHKVRQCRVPRRVEDRRGAAGHLQQQYAHGRKADSGDAGLSRRAGRRGVAHGGPVARGDLQRPLRFGLENARREVLRAVVRQRDHPCRQDRVGGGDAPPERADGRRRTADRRAAHRRDLSAAGAHLPFVDVGAERLRGRLLCRQTLFGHHRRGAAYGQLDRIPVARQVRRQQHAVE